MEARMHVMKWIIYAGLLVASGSGFTLVLMFFLRMVSPESEIGGIDKRIRNTFVGSLVVVTVSGAVAMIASYY